MICSHPNLYLSEHINQVIKAVNYIWERHSKEMATPQLRLLSERLARLHDLGKASKAFQEYIVDPNKYKGNPAEKAHTPLSAMLALLLAKNDKTDLLEAMMLTAAILGHHHELPSIEKIKDIGGGDTAQILKKQFKTLNLSDLEEYTSTTFLGADFIDERPWAVAKRFFVRDILPKFNSLSTTEAIEFRLKTQLIFSVLLEADKAFLAIANPQVYLKKESRKWQSNWVDKRLSNNTFSGISKLRKKVREELLANLQSGEHKRIYSLTAPTGIGKTLLAATWALKKREAAYKQHGIYPRIIIVLPFLSIIDQTAREYETLLKLGGQSVDGSWLLTSHSLSERQYKNDMEVEAERFFIDTWRTELVITTYDQFLYCLFDPRARYQMRFHNLCDALIILDEVQSLPCKLWKPLEIVLKNLVRIGNSQALLMSATLPPFISDAEPLLKNHTTYFSNCNRYELHLRLEQPIDIESFSLEIADRLQSWLKERKRVLITLNTRQSARLVRDTLEANWPNKYHDIPLIFITADVTPNDRLKAISVIKEGKPCIVVSTQCIEAGVDIDMDMVIRDFAPLDSLVQIAGRCNREWNNQKAAQVEIVDITNKEKSYSEMIYDNVHLAVTSQVLKDYKVVNEKKVLQLADEYFECLSRKKDTGKSFLNKFAGWKDNNDSIRELLRGKDREEYTFLVEQQDPELKAEMAKAQENTDRWERREAWRKLAPRIARISVTVYAKPGFDPSDIAYKKFEHWFLCDGFYSPEKGLVIGNQDDHLSQYIF